MKEIPLILPTLIKNKREKRGIITTSVIGFIGLAYEEISSYLHNKRQKDLQKAFDVMERNVNLERNKVFHVENSMVIYCIYNAETIEKLVSTLNNCRINLHGMKGYLQVNLLICLIGIYQNKDWYIMLYM